jgi:hypothetical protein
MPGMSHVTEDTWEMAEACREAINTAVFGGDAPHSSNALSEVTESGIVGIPGGASFSIARQSGHYEVVIVPVPMAGEFYPSVAETRKALGLPG